VSARSLFPGEFVLHTEIDSFTGRSAVKKNKWNKSLLFAGCHDVHLTSLHFYHRNLFNLYLNIRTIIIIHFLLIL